PAGRLTVYLPVLSINALVQSNGFCFDQTCTTRGVLVPGLAFHSICPLNISVFTLAFMMMISPRLLGFLYFESPGPQPAKLKLPSLSLSNTRKSNPTVLPSCK